MTEFDHWLFDFFKWLVSTFSWVFDWVFDHGTGRIYEFVVLAGVLIGGSIEEYRRITAERHKRAIAEYYDSDRENRVRICSGILSALLGESYNTQALSERMKCHPAVLRLVLKQLEYQGYIIRDDEFDEYDSEDDEYFGKYSLTQEGYDLYQKYHSGYYSEVQMGDIFNVGPNSTVVNRSYIKSAFNKIGNELDDRSQAAIRELISQVLNSGNSEAAENLDGFIDELNADSPKKGVLNSLLNGIATALPSLATATDIIENVRRIVIGI